MKIRAITAFVPKPDKDEVIRVEDMLFRVQDKTWSIRISFPPNINMSIDKLIEFDDSEVISYGLLHLTDNQLINRTTQVKEYLKSAPNLFSSILLTDPTNIVEISKFLTTLDLNEAWRFSLLINDDFLLTPYFPAGVSKVKENSFAISLIYVSDYKNGTSVHALKKADEIGKEIEREYGIKYLGIDASLSPWLNESVGKVIEERSGKIFSPSNLWEVYRINQDIRKVSFDAGINSLGFSEVMLPVAEDNVLYERAVEGSVSLYQLISLSQVCVAGLDMVGIEPNVNLIEMVLKDLYAIQKVKLRPYGIRLIPQTEDIVNLSNIGLRVPKVKTN